MALETRAHLIFEPGDIPFPDEPQPLIEANKYQKEGCEVGWLGFPGLPNAGLSFFSGRISSYIESQEAYLVDGVAINGVSGGPAFICGLENGKDSTRGDVIGVVSAYIANRTTGETLPGLAVIRDVSEFHEVVARLRSLEDAQGQQTRPGDAPPPVVPEGGTRAPS